MVVEASMFDPVDAVDDVLVDIVGDVVDDTVNDVAEGAADGVFVSVAGLFSPPIVHLSKIEIKTVFISLKKAHHDNIETDNFY